MKRVIRATKATVRRWLLHSRFLSDVWLAMYNMLPDKAYSEIIKYL